MSALPSLFATYTRWQRRTLVWLASWWRLLHFGAIMLTLALSPSSYRGASRSILARQIVLATTPNLLRFGVISALVSLVLIRIVVVTSLSYGLSRYALEMVVRVLVLELIPLTAAAFIALRSTLPDSLELVRKHAARSAAERAALARSEFFPRVMAGVFSVWLLAAVSCVLALLLTYLALYGFTPWALAGYTRVVGQVFNPAVSLILLLKIIFFSVAVALIPLAAPFYDGAARLTYGWPDMVRVFSIIFLIELVSLMGNYS